MRPDPLKAELKASILRVRDGILLAGIGLIFASPHLFDQAHSLFPRLFKQPGRPEQIQLFFLAELILYFFALFLFILIGILANKRAELKPFQERSSKRIFSSLGLGIIFIPASYLLYDHLVLFLLPELYPRRLSFALIYPFSISLPQELITRYGLLSLFAWIFGKSWNKRMLANILSSALLTSYSFWDFFRLVETPVSPMETILFVSGIFLQQLIAGELYLKAGFFPSLSFNFGLSLKNPLYFFLFFS